MAKSHEQDWKARLHAELQHQDRETALRLIEDVADRLEYGEQILDGYDDERRRQGRLGADLREAVLLLLDK